jgi:hypothetical protein
LGTAMYTQNCASRHPIPGTLIACHSGPYPTNSSTLTLCHDFGYKSVRSSIRLINATVGIRAQYLCTCKMKHHSIKMFTYCFLLPSHIFSASSVFVFQTTRMIVALILPLLLHVLQSLKTYSNTGAEDEKNRL